jgi:TolB-like protein
MATIHSFGPFRLDAEAAILFRDGQPVPIGGRAASLLRVLVERPGSPVSKADLIEAAWPGLSIEESNLSVQIAALRKVLAEEPGGDRWIETLSRRGYRFVGPKVESRDSAAGPSEPDSAAPERPSIAVLPLLAMSDGADVAQFGDGLAEDVITALSRSPDLLVVARNSSFVYRGRAVDIRQVGQELGAKYLIEGSVRRVGERLRVVAQLIDADDGSHVWADRFDCVVDNDVLRTQDQLTHEIVTAIRLKLLRESTPLGVDQATRRLVTILFCRLVGAPAWSDSADPQSARRLIAAYQRCCADAINRLGGVVAVPGADAVEAHFGLPPALERGAECAVRVALAIRQSVQKIDGAAGEPMRVQIGVATGTALVGDLGSNLHGRGYGAVGEPVDLARRLCADAGADAIAICGRTRELAGGLFEYSANDGDPSGASHVIAEVPADTRFAALHEEGLAPMVGRADQLAQLTRHWSDCKCEAGQVVFIAGDPGIGKSRLLAALRERIEGEPHEVIHFACAPHGTDTALFPIIEQIERAAGLHRGDTAEEKLAKLDGLLHEPTHGNDEAAWLMAELFSLQRPAPPAVSSVTPRRRKQIILETLLSHVAAQAARHPILVEFEDVHWADSTSVEFLSLLIGRVTAMRALVLITARPEFAIPWPDPEDGAQIRLTRLNRRDSARLAAWIAGDNPVSQRDIDRIVERADGVPLFIEELTRTVLEKPGALGNKAASIPVTLENSLLTRLERMAAVGDLASVGAVLGRQFSHELVSAVSSLPDGVLDQRLDQLIKSGLIFRHGTAPDAIYTFKHALVRDTVYARLVGSARRSLHARVVDVVETRFPEFAQSQPGWWLTTAWTGTSSTRRSTMR